MQVNLCWRPPLVAHSLPAHSSPMVVSTIDRHVYNHMTLNNVNCLEWSHSTVHVLDHVENRSFYISWSFTS